MASIKRKAASGCGTPSTSPLPSKKIKLDDMQNWVSKLDTTLDKSITAHSVLGKIFGDKLLLKSIQKHKLFWPKLIGSIVCGVHHRPETTICWMSFHLINLINEEKLVLSSAAELLSYIQPFMKIKDLFHMFANREQVPTSENIGYYRFSYEAATSGRGALISIASRNSTSDILIAQITEDSVSEVTRNTCLLITFLITLCENDEKVHQLITLENEEVLNFLSAAILDIKKRSIDSSQSLYYLQNSVEQIQTANFALMAFMQCFDEIPIDKSFADLLSNDVKVHLSNLYVKTFKEHAMGKVESWPADPEQYATLIFQVLVTRTLARIYNSAVEKPPQPFVACTVGMNPLSWGRWVFGNYAIAHQTYQFRMTKPLGDVSQLYAELRPLTSGPIKFGFALSVENESETLQDLTEAPGAICYDYYENGLWISKKEYISKKDNDKPVARNLNQAAESTAFPQGRNQVVIGVLLNIKAKNELEAVKFFVNGQEINSQMDVCDIPKFSAKTIWEDPSQFLLSVAPAAYQQAILVLNRQYWEYNRHNEEIVSFENLLLEENEAQKDTDDTGDTNEAGDASDTRDANDAGDAGEILSNLMDNDENANYDEPDYGEEEDIDNENDDDGDPLGLRDIDWLSEYETSDRSLTEKY